jgi:hypothetical protein
MASCILIHSSVALLSLHLIDALLLSDFPDVPHCTLPGGLRIIKVEPTFEDTVDHALKIKPCLPDHVVFINRDERGLRHDLCTIPCLNRDQIMLRALVLALKATDDISSDLVITHPFALVLLFHDNPFRRSLARLWLE